MSALLFTLLALMLVVVWYLSFTATRLDRLHHRVETSWANLDAALKTRSALALEIPLESRRPRFIHVAPGGSPRCGSR